MVNLTISHYRIGTKSFVYLKLGNLRIRLTCDIQQGPSPPFGSSFLARPSTSVLLGIESFLYRESYCSLGLTRIHSPFNEEDFLDWFRTPHYPALFHAAAAHRSLDDGSRGW